jgi:hypothetical protein
VGKLISALAAIVLTTSTLANAAPRQTAKGKTGKATVSRSAKHAKAAKRPVVKAAAVQRASAVREPLPVRSAPREPLPVRTTTPYAVAPVAKTAVLREHDVKAEELEIKRLKTNIKTAEKAGDWRRAARDRRAMYQLEADVRADKKDSQDLLRASKDSKKKSRIPFWGWWR